MNLSWLIKPTRSRIYLPGFFFSSSGPIHIANEEQCEIIVNKSIAEITQRYQEDGFAHFKYYGPGEQAIHWIASRLELGQPFVPAYNRDNPAYCRNGYNKIRFSSPSPHRAFSSTQAQGLHVDGTLTPIGMIKTSVLLCEEPAEIGGETTLFKAVAAFAALFHDDHELGNSLLSYGVLTRCDIGLTQQCMRGAAFAINENELVSRFSIDNTSFWAKSQPLAVSAFQYLKLLATQGSPFYYSLKLNAQEGIIIANDKISHGRRRFYERTAGTRCMLRALFLHRPSSLGFELH
jgi:hypothetical protein